MIFYRDGDVLAMRQEIEDLKTSLREERSFTDELNTKLKDLPDDGGTKAIPLTVQVCAFAQYPV